MPDYDPLVLGYRRVSGGDMQVTVSLAPGVRVHLQVAAGAFDAGALGELAGHVVGQLTRPHGAAVTQPTGGST